MDSKNLKIGTQLKTGFFILLFFILTIGIVSYWQTEQIHQQTKDLFQHPLKVQHAIGELETDILKMHRDTKDLFLSKEENIIGQNLDKIEICKTDAFERIEEIYQLYLGPQADIDSVKLAFITWNTMRIETIRLLKEGKIEEGAKRTQTNGIAANQVEIILKAIQKIDDYSNSKGNELYNNSLVLDQNLLVQLTLLIIFILIISLFIYYILLRNIRKPLTAITEASYRFKNGDLNARSNYISQNEFGLLSEAFNEMVENIQQNINLSQRISDISSKMLGEDDVSKFFLSTLNTLAYHTNSQVAAVYLLSEDKKRFDLFESLGMENSRKQSFDTDTFEGELGLSVYSRKIIHTKDLGKDSAFEFHTASGKFIPREILTIPIVVSNEVKAIISLANINCYDNQAVKVIDTIINTLNARIGGILSYRKIKDFSEKLTYQNKELDAQKTELAAQSNELIEQNTELVMQKNQLNEANRLKTNFLSNMSHELRTPLNSIIALSGVLHRRLTKKIPDEEYSYLEVIERNGKHLLALINDILDISRIESGREDVVISQFNMNYLVSEVVNMIDPQARMKNISLIHHHPEAEINLTSDDHKCRHILLNLIGNAIKFTETGTVEISVSKDDNFITVAVTDTGIGISEEHLTHIFDEFRQADGSTSRRYGGTGLGLAIAKKYSKMLGGTIAANSSPGSGSVFTLRLPVIFSPDQNELKNGSLNTTDQTLRQKNETVLTQTLEKTILLVEDSEPAIIQINDILEESGYHLLVAREGSQAIEMLSQVVPDALILDLMMPGVDGFEVLKTIREHDHPASKMPVLILTAKHISKEELMFLKGNNIYQLIRKGDINRDEFLKSIAEMVFSGIPKKKPVSEQKTIIGKPYVLVVEDNPDNMLTVTALLGADFIVNGAIDGLSGIEMAMKLKPNLILMDIALPGLNGIEAFKAIRAEALLSHIPVIALTASAMTSDRESILAHGFDAYIAKPIDEIHFFKTINEVLYGK
ncbi:MAG: response regulator [Bacteroidales bacterium]|nr:response regulator [Bacteroidales bacterium]